MSDEPTHSERGMKTKLHLTLIAAFLFLPLGSEAAAWSVVVSNEKMRTEIDLASFMRQGAFVTAWDRDIYFVPEQARPGDFYFKSAKALVRYSCDARTADLLMRVYYAADGSEIKTVTASYYGRPNYVIPDTDDEKKLEYVCKYKTPEELRLAALARKQAKAEAEAEKKAKAEKAKEAEQAADLKAKKTLPGGKAQPAVPAVPPKHTPILKPSGLQSKPAAG